MVRVLVGGEEEVHGLARWDGDVGSAEWLGVAAVGADDGERVVGDGEEQDVLHGGVH